MEAQKEHFGHKSHATASYTEQAGAKANLGELEYLDPMGQDYLDKLEHIRGAVAHHMHEEESDDSRATLGTPRRT